MAEAENDWLIDEPPSTDDPEDLRAYIRDLETIEPQTPAIRSMMDGAKRMLTELEREKAQSAA